MKKHFLWLALALWGCGGAPTAGEGRRGPGATPVATAPVARDDMVVFGTYSGELVADVADLAARVAGRLDAVAVRMGDPVARGQVLARVDDDALRQALAEAEAQVQVADAGLARTRTEAELAGRDLARAEPLAAKALISAQEADETRAAAQALQAEVAVSEARLVEAQARVARLAQQVADARVVAPFDGVVVERYLDPGATVQVGSPVLRVVAGGPLRVRFRVPEQEFAGLVPGLALSVTVGGLEDVDLPGVVERISGAVSSEDRAVAAEGVLALDDRLRPGMFARVQVERQRIEGALVLPGAAVLERADTTGTQRGVFTVAGEAAAPLARWVPLQVRGRAGDRVAVAGELEPGQAVLVLGHESLSDGAPIRVATVQP